MQQIAVILVVLACAAWLGIYAWRFFKPKKGRACGGNCCDGGAAEKKPAEPAAGQTVFFRSEDLVARIKARKG
jgi:hypothetical protein